MSSVPYSRRKISDAEYIKVARELEIYTLQKVGSNQFPKRQTFHIGAKLTSMAYDICDHVAQANDIKVKNSEHARSRERELMAARRLLVSFIQQVDIACEVAKFSVDIMDEWMELVEKEKDLIQGVIKSDRARYKRMGII